MTGQGPFQLYHQILPSGYRLRYGVAPGVSKDQYRKSSVLLLPGRAEYLEKYNRLVDQLTAEGVTVVGLDWRGQGGSARELQNTQKGYIHDFADYMTDFAAIWPTLKQHMSGPVLGLGHSMGGHLLLRLLGDTPDFVDRVVLSAPMTDLAILGIKRRLVHALAQTLPPHMYVPGGRSWRPYETDYPRSVLTSDLAQLQQMTQDVEANPLLKMGHATVGWLRAALASIEALQAPGQLEKITQPVDVMAGTRDVFISVDQQQATIERLPNGKLTVLADSLHEPFFEREPIRTQAMDILWGALNKL